MDEALQFRIDGFPDGTDLLQGQFPLQDEPSIAEAFGETGLLRSPDGALGRGMEDHPFRSKPRHGRILDDEGVHPGLLQLLKEPADFRNFFLIDKGIHRHIDPNAETMRIPAQAGDIFDAVPGRLPGAKGRSGDIDGIRPAVDGCDADVRRPGGRKEFEGTHRPAISYRR